MSPETALLSFGVITLALVGFEIMFTYATQGFAYGFAADRPQVALSPFAQRVKRALQNHIEAAAYVAPVLAAAALLDVRGGGVEIAAMLIVIGRAAFPVLYYTGITFIRVPAFVLGTFPTLYIALAALLG